jgi:hypothetical protein
MKSMVRGRITMIVIILLAMLILLVVAVPVWVRLRERISREDMARVQYEKQVELDINDAARLLKEHGRLPDL